MKESGLLQVLRGGSEGSQMSQTLRDGNFFLRLEDVWSQESRTNSYCHFSLSILFLLGPDVDAVTGSEWQSGVNRCQIFSWRTGERALGNQKVGLVLGLDMGG